MDRESPEFDDELGRLGKHVLSLEILFRITFLGNALPELATDLLVLFRVVALGLYLPVAILYLFRNPYIGINCVFKG